MDSPALAAFVRARVAPAATAWEEHARAPFDAGRSLLAEGIVRVGGTADADGIAARLALAAEMAAVDSIGAAATLLHLTGAPLAVLGRLASPEAQARFLAPALRGGACGAVAFPRADADRPIVLTRRGDRFALDGIVPVALGVPGAEWIAIPARPASGGRRTVLAVVPLDAEGVSAGRIDTVGLHAAALGEVRLDGCVVEPWQVLGEAVDEVVAAALADERLLLAGVAAAAAGRCLRRTLAFVGTRALAPGQTLGDQPVVRHRLADLSADHGVAAAFHHEAAAERLHAPLSPARAAGVAWVCVGALRRVSEGCMQLLGARGFMDEHPVSRAYRDALTLPLLPALDPDALLRDAGAALFGASGMADRSNDGAWRSDERAPFGSRSSAGHPLPLVTAALAFAGWGDVEPEDVGRVEKRFATRGGRATTVIPSIEPPGGPGPGPTPGSAPFAGTAAHLAFRERVSGFVRERVLPHAEAWDRGGTLPRELFRAAGEAGLLGVMVPASSGGSGLGLSYAVAAAEELMRHRVACAVSLMVQSNCVCPILARHAGEELRRDALAPLAAGDAVGALGSTEPGGGSALPHTLATTAVRDGGDWVVTGEKRYITNAPLADWVLVLARTSEGAGPLTMTLIAVPADAPGFERGETHRKLGLGGSPTGALRMDRCRVPARYTVGRVGFGYPQMARVLSHERLLIGVGAVAYARALVQETAAWAGPHAPADARATLVGALAALDAARAFAYAAARRGVAGEPDAGDSALCKLAACELAQRVAAECARLRGPGAARADGGLAPVLRDVRALTVFGGTSETMREMYGATLAAAMRRATLEVDA
jgi:alkylation response protein AidB-like acyl-CoA dehydrogenase